MDHRGLGLDTLPVEIRPDRSLLTYYAVASLVAGPFFWIPLVPLWLRYRTLVYRVDEDGISMSRGALFRKEVSLNYGRIQDIHLTSNVVERWLGLGRIQIQTASGASGAELTIEGVPELHRVRDFLYGRMRGARGDDGRATIGAGAGVVDSAGFMAGSTGAADGPAGAAGGPDRAAGPGADDLASTLREVAAEVRALREELAAREGGGAPSPDGEARGG